MSTALLLIDCQVDFGAPEGAMARRGADIGPAQAALKQAAILADTARARGVPVVFVRLVSRPGPLALCVEGTPGADFIGPQPQPGERVISKKMFSAFHGTGLAEMLQADGVDRLVLAGLTTECCVAASAWAAFEYGFGVAIATDACAAYEPGLHAGAMKALELSGARLHPASEFATVWK